MFQLDGSAFGTVLDQVGDTPFTATPYFFLHRQACDVYADSPVAPKCLVIVPQIPSPDIYVLGEGCLDSEGLERLADFLVSLELVGGLCLRSWCSGSGRATRSIWG